MENEKNLGIRNIDGSKVEINPSVSRNYRVIVDDHILLIEVPHPTGKLLLKYAGKIPYECFSLYQKLKGCDFEKISLDEEVDLTNPGIEKFVTKPTEVFYYSVDDEPETTDEKFLTANGILKLAGIKPIKDFFLILINPDGSQISYKENPEQRIVMRCPQMKFVTAYRGETPVS